MKSVLLAASCVLLFVACGPTCGSSASPVSTPTPHTVLDTHGTDSKSTGTFTVPAEWFVGWTFTCPARCTFTIQVHTPDGRLSTPNQGFSETEVVGQGVLRYHTGGTFYLTVDVCCAHNSWTLKVGG